MNQFENNEPAQFTDSKKFWIDFHRSLQAYLFPNTLLSIWKNGPYDSDILLVYRGTS